MPRRPEPAPSTARRSRRTPLRRVVVAALCLAGVTVLASLVACSRTVGPATGADVRLPSGTVVSGLRPQATAPVASGTAASGRGVPGRSGPVVETVRPSVAVSTMSPVRLGEPAPISPRVEVSVGPLRTVQIQASAPGDTSGPAVSFVVEVRNGSTRSIDLSGMSVTGSYGAGIPAEPVSASPSVPLGGVLPAGRAAHGTYVLRMPEAAVGTVRIQVSSDFAAAVAVFRR